MIQMTKGMPLKAVLANLVVFNLVSMFIRINISVDIFASPYNLLLITLNESSAYS